MIETFRKMLESTELTGLQVICISVMTSTITFILAFIFKIMLKFIQKITKHMISTLKNKCQAYKIHKNGQLTMEEMIDLERKINDGIPLSKKELKMKIIYDEEIKSIKETMKDIDFSLNIVDTMGPTTFIRNQIKK